jgi:hypothetical protein
MDSEKVGQTCRSAGLPGKTARDVTFSEILRNN